MDRSTLNQIKESLGTKTLEPTGQKASGCINEGEAYKTDQGLVFIKKSSSPNVRNVAIIIMVTIANPIF